MPDEKPLVLVKEQYKTTRQEVLLCMAMEFVVWLWSINKMIDSQNSPITLCAIGVAFVWMSAKVGWLMHRLGAFNKNLERDHLNGWGWENLKPTEPMAIVAIGASLPQVWYFAYGAGELWRAGNVTASALAVLLFAMGAVVVPIVTKLPYRK